MYSLLAVKLPFIYAYIVTYPAVPAPQLSINRMLLWNFPIYMEVTNTLAILLIDKPRSGPNYIGRLLDTESVYKLLKKCVN